MTLVAATSETIDALLYDSVRGWVSRQEDHGRIKLSAYTVPDDARAFRIAYKDVLYKMGLQKADLCRIRSSSTSINGSSLNMIGIIILRLAGMDPLTGKRVETAAQVRVA